MSSRVFRWFSLGFLGKNHLILTKRGAQGAKASAQQHVQRSGELHVDGFRGGAVEKLGGLDGSVAKLIEAQETKQLTTWFCLRFVCFFGLA